MRTLARQVVDATIEAYLDLSSRPLRALLGTAAVLVATGTAVGTAHLVEAGRLQVASVLDEQRPTVVELVVDGADMSELITLEDEVSSAAGVEGAALVARMPALVEVSPSATPRIDAEKTMLQVVGIGESAPRVLGGQRLTGSPLQSWYYERGARVAFLGEIAARTLGLSGSRWPPGLEINGEWYAFGGIFQLGSRYPDLAASVLMPWSVIGAMADESDSVPDTVLMVRTHRDHTELLAERLPWIIAPYNPGSVTSFMARSPETLAAAINPEVTRMAAVVTIATGAMGLLSISIITLTNVLERIPRIGLERALGASRGVVALEVIIESTMLGLIGGIVGASLGLIGSAVFASARGWPGVFDLMLTWISVVVAATAGAMAGVGPAVRAGRVEPDVALRSTVV